jgi:hypothetical protein
MTLGSLAVDYCSEKAPARRITMWLPLHHGQEEAEMLFIAPESCILFSDLNPDLTNELND